MIEKRILELSSTKEIFDDAKGHYEEALKKSEYNKTLEYKAQKT